MPGAEYIMTGTAMASFIGSSSLAPPSHRREDAQAGHAYAVLRHSPWANTIRCHARQPMAHISRVEQGAFTDRRLLPATESARAGA